jgi:hypothetical protein
VPILIQDSEFIEVPAAERELLNRHSMSLVALVPAVVACVLFVETLRIRPGTKH